MQSIITFALILALISPCFGSNYTFYNVMDFGAVGDAKTDDSQVSLFFGNYSYSCMFIVKRFTSFFYYNFFYPRIGTFLKSPFSLI